MSSAPDLAQSNDATLAILAGGAGSRMGQPKGFLTLGPKPILDYLLDQLQWPGATMLITAPSRENPPGWKRFKREISDPASGGGPLRGILTALENLETPLMFALTVDMPCVRISHCVGMLEALRNNSKAFGVMMRRNVEGRGRVEPFPCAFRLDATAVVARRLAEGKRSVQGLLDEPGFAAIDSPEDWPANVWTNLNVPGDLREFARLSAEE